MALLRMGWEKNSIGTGSYITSYDSALYLPHGHNTYDFKFEHLNNLFLKCVLCLRDKSGVGLYGVI
jgi:hypothetical protein